MLEQSIVSHGLGQDVQTAVTNARNLLRPEARQHIRQMLSNLDRSIRTPEGATAPIKAWSVSRKLHYAMRFSAAVDDMLKQGHFDYPLDIMIVGKIHWTEFFADLHTEVTSLARSFGYLSPAQTSDLLKHIDPLRWQKRQQRVATLKVFLKRCFGFLPRH